MGKPHFNPMGYVAAFKPGARLSIGSSAALMAFDDPGELTFSGSLCPVIVSALFKIFMLRQSLTNSLNPS